MCKDVNFKVVEKYKNKDIQEISKYVNAIVNKLIENEFQLQLTANLTNISN